MYSTSFQMDASASPSTSTSLSEAGTDFFPGPSIKPPPPPTWVWKCQRCPTLQRFRASPRCLSCSARFSAHSGMVALFDQNQRNEWRLYCRSFLRNMGAEELEGSDISRIFHTLLGGPAENSLPEACTEEEYERLCQLMNSSYEYGEFIDEWEEVLSDTGVSPNECLQSPEGWPIPRQSYFPQTTDSISLTPETGTESYNDNEGGDGINPYDKIVEEEVTVLSSLPSELNSALEDACSDSADYSICPIDEDDRIGQRNSKLCLADGQTKVYTTEIEFRCKRSYIY